MSWFSKFVRDHFATNTSETAAQVLERIAGQAYPQIQEYASEVVAMMAATGGKLSKDQQQMLATEIIKNAAAMVFHVNLPDVAVNFLVEEAWLLLSGGKSKSNPLPSPVPPPATP